MDDYETLENNKTKYKFDFKKILVLLFSTISFMSFYPNSWITDLFSHFRIHFIVLTIIYIIGSFFISKNISIFLSLVLLGHLALAGWAINSNFKFSPIPQTENISLTILSSNILFKNNIKSETLSQISKIDADIVVLSEANKIWFTKIIENLGNQYQYIERSTESGRADVTILSKYPLDEIVPFKTLGNHSGLRVLVNKDDKKIALYGIHPYSPMSNKHWKLRNNFLNDLSKEINKEKYPTIVTGDFNISIWSTFFQNFLKKSNMKSSNIFKGTFPSSLNVFGITIDHLVHSPQIQAKTTPLKIKGSDHLGLLSIVKF